MPKFIKLYLLPILALLWLVSCGDDDNGPGDPGGDTNAPTVLSVSPDQDATGVGPDDQIAIVFDEDMDETSADGNVSLSSGAVATTTWSDARTLVITHSNWAEGTNVEVTLGTAIKDLAGNGLAAPHVWDFWTASSVPSLLRTIPEDGTTGVSTGVTVRLLFSEAMDLPSLRAATIAFPTPARIPVFEFTMSEGEGGWIDMAFNAALPLSTPVTISISTEAMTATGTNLPAPEQFDFVTTDQVDNTPPNLISIVPANGSTIPAGTSSIVFTFDEAIDDQRFNPSQISGQLFVYLSAAAAEPSWSVDGTVLTVTLPTPLPAGSPLVARFDSYFDVAGNEQTTPIDYRVDVEGAADFWPFDLGARFMYWETWSDFEPGVGTSEGAGEAYYGFDADGPDTRWARFDDPGFTTTNEWETYRQAIDEVQFRGFYDNTGGGIEDVTLNPPVIWARLPFAIDNWSDSSTASSGPESFPVSYDVEFFAQENLTSSFSTEPGSATEVIWFDCFKSTRAWNVANGMSTGNSTLWYAPGVGIVLTVTHEEESTGEISDTTEEFVTRIFLN